VSWVRVLTKEADDAAAIGSILIKRVVERCDGDPTAPGVHMRYAYISNLGYAYFLSPRVAELAADLLKDYHDVTSIDAPDVQGLMRVL
jgi:hypothetical protein